MKWWRLKRWRIMHKPGSPCTRFNRYSCDVPKKELQPRHGFDFMWGRKPIGIGEGWSIRECDFGPPGRYISPYWDLKEYIRRYGIEKWREAVGPDGVEFFRGIPLRD